MMGFRNNKIWNEIRTFEGAGFDGRQLIGAQTQPRKRIGSVCWGIEWARFDWREEVIVKEGVFELGKGFHLIWDTR